MVQAVQVSCGSEPEMQRGKCLAGITAGSKLRSVLAPL